MTIPSSETTRSAPASILANIRRIIHAIHAQSARIEESSGLTGPQFWALREINESITGLPLGELAQKLVLHKATAGRIVERLQEMRLVECERPANDRRYVLARITAAGRKVASKPVSGPAQAGLLGKLEKLAPADVASIDLALGRVVAMLDAQNMDAGPLFEGKSASKRPRKRTKRSRKS